MRNRCFKFAAVLSVLLGSYSNAFAQSVLNWQPTTGPLTIGTVGGGGIVEDKRGILYAGAGYSSTNQGLTWRHEAGWFVTDVDSSGRLYAKSSNSFGYSDDGAHWNSIPVPQSIQPIDECSFRASGSGLLIASDQPSFDTVVVSTNFGLTWRQVPPYINLSVWWGDTLLAAGDYPEYILSSDLGESWAKYRVDPTFDSLWNLGEVQRIDDSDVYAFYYGLYDFDGTYYLSHDRGEHFSKITEPSDGVSFFVPGPGKGTYIAGKPYVTYGGSDDTVLITHDDGQTWQPIPQLLSHVGGVRSGLYTREGNILIGSDAMNFVSYDSGASWTSSNTIYAYTGKFVSHAGKLWTTSFDTTLDMTTDDGNTWNYINTPVPISDFFIASSGAVVINGGYADPHVSTDNGNSWQDIFQGSPVGLTVIGDTIFLATDSTLLMSTSLGNMWDTLSFPDTVDGYPTISYLITPQGAVWMYVQDSLFPRGSISISNDLGKTFGPIMPMQSSYAWEPDFFDSSGNIYIFQYPNLYRSSNNGVTWDTIPTPLNGDEALNDLWINDSGLFVSIDSGIYRTPDDGITWISENVGIPNRNVGYLGSQDGYIFVGTDGGVYRTKDSLLAPGGSSLTQVFSIPHATKDSTVVSDGGGVQVTLSPSIQLESFPNPLSQSTQITFTLPEASEVTLTISDATGRETPLLRSAWFPAGEHEIAWDASNYPSGVYLCRLSSGGASVTERVVVLK